MQLAHRKPKLLPKLMLPLTLIPTTRSSALTFERAVEPPPALYAQGPTLTGRTYEIRLDSIEAVDQVCRTLLHGLPQGASKGDYYMGCYAPRLDAVILMQPKAWPSRREWEQIRAHEWAHARGWRHRRDGTGTDWLASLPPRGRAGSASAAAAASPPQG